MSGNMVVHAGAWEATREQLDAVPVPLATETYFPVAHGDVIDNVKRAAQVFQLDVSRERFALARDGAQLFAMLDLVAPGDMVDDALARTGLSAIIRNSYDMSVSIAIGCGENTFICDNMSLAADWLKTRKHTPNAWKDLYGFLYGSFATVLQQHAEFKAHRDAMRLAQLDQRDADHMVLSCYRNGALVAGDIGNVLKEYGNPTVAAWNDEPLNAWRLYNAITQVAKSWSPIIQLERTRKATDTFVKVLS